MQFVYTVVLFSIETFLTGQDRGVVIYINIKCFKQTALNMKLDVHVEWSYTLVIAICVLF